MLDFRHVRPKPTTPHLWVYTPLQSKGPDLSSDRGQQKRSWEEIF